MSDVDPHVAEDLAVGQGVADDPYAIPAEDVAQLAGIRADADQGAIVALDEENLEFLVADELRDGETDDPDEAAEEGLTYVPPVDPPIVPVKGGQIDVAAGFGATADDEPFDEDHHRSVDFADDEMTERVREALLAHATTVGLVDRLELDTDGSRVIVAGTVDDLDDEDQVLAVVSEVDGVADVVSRIEVLAVE